MGDTPRSRWDLAAKVILALRGFAQCRGDVSARMCERNWCAARPTNSQRPPIGGIGNCGEGKLIAGINLVTIRTIRTGKQVPDRPDLTRVMDAWARLKGKCPDGRVASTVGFGRQPYCACRAGP